MWFPKSMSGWIKACSTNRVKHQRRWSRCSLPVASEQLEDRVVLSVTLFGLPNWNDLGSKPMVSAGSVSDPNNPASGAIEEVAIDPNNPAHIVVGTVNGGIWRTTNGNRPFNGVDDDAANGVDDALEQPDWVPLTDNFASLAIGDIAFSPLDATGNTIFAGTGSSSSLGNSGGQPIGVLRTTDGGNTWSGFQITPAPGEPPVRAILPTTFDGDPGTLGVQQTVLVGTTTATGLYRSINGGQTYAPISGTGVGLPNGAVTQIVGDPNNASRYFAGVVGQGVYLSTDGGGNWAPVNGTGGNILTNLGASTSIQVAADPGGGVTRLYALISGPTVGAFTSTDGGTNWTALAAVPAGFANATFNNFYTGMASDQLVIDPTNPLIVYVSNGYGGSQIFRYDPVAVNWVQINGGAFAAGGTTPHADNRDLKFVGNNVLISANDGGIYFMQNPQNAVANRWTSLHGRGTNGLGVTEHTNVAWDSRFDVATGGAQDNGTTVENGAGDVVWTSYNGADGGDVQVDIVNAGAGRSFRYASVQNFSFFAGSRALGRYTFDSATNQPIGSVELMPAGGLANFNAPFTPLYELNAVNLGRLVTGDTTSSPGTSPVYELTNAATAPNAAGATWVAVPVGAGFGAVSGSAIAVGGRLNGLDNPEVLVVGSAGRVFVRSTAGGTLTATTATFPGGTIQDIVLDPNNWQHFFVADGSNVYETTDAGATAGNWRNLTPVGRPTGNTSLQSIEFIPSATGGTVLVGGNLGVSRLALGPPNAPWTRFGLGLPNALVQDLDYDATDNVLLAGTFGRGAWSIPNVTAVIETPGVLNVCGDELFPNQDDTVRLVRNAVNPLLLEVYVNGVLEFSNFLVAIQQINVFTAGGNDLLIVDSTNGLITVPNGIRYDGDNGCPGQAGAGLGGFDTLRLDQTGGSQSSDVYSVGPGVGQGTSTITGMTGTQQVFFANLEPVLDLVPATSLTVNATPESNVINYTVGSVVANGKVTVDNYESIEFSNKVAVTINALVGNDLVNLNNTAIPIALTSITINANDGEDVVTTLAALATTAIFNGGNGNDSLNAAGATAASTLDGGTGNDTLIGGSAGDALLGQAGEDVLDGRGGANSLNGGSESDTILVSGTSGPDTITTTHGAGTFDITGGLSAGTNTITGLEEIRIEVGNGADNITLNLLAAGGLDYTVLGGNPIGSPGDVLTVNSTVTMTVTPGPENDAGSVDAATTIPTNVSFDEIEQLVLGGGGGAVVNGTNGNDAITVIARDDSFNPAADGVQDFTVVVNAGLQILYLNTATLTVNALAGSDEIDLQTPAPNNANWDVDVTIDGGPPAASDKLVVETPGATAENVNYIPTAPDAGLMSIGESNPAMATHVMILGTEELVYVGRGDNDSFIVFGNSDKNTFRHTPAANDGGTISVDLKLPFTYQNLGTSGSPRVNGVGASTDTLIYDGTLGSDAFAVLDLGGGEGQVNLNAHLPLRTQTFQILQLLGKSGDDTFSLLPAISASPYTTINIDGGSQASATGDVVNLIGTAAADSIVISGQNVSAGGKAVNSIGVENINLDSKGDSDLLTYNGVPGLKENIKVYGSTTPGSGQITVPGVTNVTFLNSEAIVVNGNVPDVDTLTFFGTNTIDTFQITLSAVGTAADPVLKLQNANGSTTLLTLINYTGFDTLNANAGDGNDLVNVYTAKTGPSRNLFVDGDLPTGKNKGTDKLSVFYSGKRPRIVHSAATQNPSSGIVTLDYGTAFFRVAYAGMEIVTIQK